MSPGLFFCKGRMPLGKVVRIVQGTEFLAPLAYPQPRAGFFWAARSVILSALQVARMDRIEWVFAATVMVGLATLGVAILML